MLFLCCYLNYSCDIILANEILIHSQPMNLITTERLMHADVTNKCRKFRNEILNRFREITVFVWVLVSVWLGDVLAGAPDL